MKWNKSIIKKNYFVKQESDPSVDWFKGVALEPTGVTKITGRALFWGRSWTLEIGIGVLVLEAFDPLKLGVVISDLAALLLGPLGCWQIMCNPDSARLAKSMTWLVPWHWSRSSILSALNMELGSGKSPRRHNASNDFHSNGFNFNAFRSASLARGSLSVEV